MRITVQILSGPAEDQPVTWPEGWPIPRVGDSMAVHGRIFLKVTDVSWYLEPCRPLSGHDEPFVLVQVEEMRVG